MRKHKKIDNLFSYESERNLQWRERKCDLENIYIS